MLLTSAKMTLLANTTVWIKIWHEYGMGLLSRGGGLRKKNKNNKQ
jgi:hypothetical protein